MPARNLFSKVSRLKACKQSMSVFRNASREPGSMYRQMFETKNVRGLTSIFGAARRFNHSADEGMLSEKNIFDE